MGPPAETGPGHRPAGASSSPWALTCLSAGLGHSPPSCISSSDIQRLVWLPHQALNQPWIMHEIQPQAAHSLLKHQQFIQKECSPSVLPHPQQNTKGKALANSQEGGCCRAGVCPARPSSALPPGWVRQEQAANSLRVSLGGSDSPRPEGCSIFRHDRVRNECVELGAAILRSRQGSDPGCQGSPSRKHPPLSPSGRTAGRGSGQWPTARSEDPQVQADGCKKPSLLQLLGLGSDSLRWLGAGGGVV